MKIFSIILLSLIDVCYSQEKQNSSSSISYTSLTNIMGPFNFMLNTNLFANVTVTTNTSQPSLQNLTLYITNQTANGFRVYMLAGGGSYTGITNLWTVNYGFTYPSPAHITFGNFGTNAAILNTYRQTIVQNTTTNFTFYNASVAYVIGNIYEYDFTVTW